MTRLRLRPSTVAVRGQTRAYAERAGELVAQLRQELSVPSLPLGSPVAVILMGVPGVGKSHCARLLAARLGAAHVASDHLRSRLFIAATYTADENAAVFRCVDGLVDQLLREGHRVIVDATHLLARYRDASAGAAARHGAPIVFVLVTSDDAAIRRRLAARRTARALDDHSDADERVYERMRDRAFEPPAEGHLELLNGPGLDAGIERVAREVERVCASAI